MNSENIERAQLLLNQSRGAEAEEYARLAIQDNADDPKAYLMLGLSFLEQGKDKDALGPFQQALQLAPDWAYIHYKLAVTYFQLEDWKKSHACAEEALRLDTDFSEVYGLLAYLAIRKSKWEEALTLAERGLGIDSDDVTCTNARVQALSNLGRLDHAQESLDYALHRDPENPITHYQKGNTLLREGKFDEAAQHFCEALRLEPNLEEAKSGLVEALKGKHFVYSLFLKYIFFMTRLTPGQRWGLIIGGLVGHRVLFRTLANSGQMGLAYGVRFLYLLIVYFTWTASSLFNLLLFVHPQGRHALSDKQKKTAAVVGLSSLGAFGFAVAFFAQHTETYLMLCILMLTITIPASVLDHVSKPNKRALVWGVCALQLTITVGALGVFYSGEAAAADSLASMGIFIGVGFSWLSGFFTD